jgi:hypothetical protein
VLTDDALVGCTAGRRAQNGCTLLGMASHRGHVVAVELLLAHADVKVNQATKVRGRGWWRAGAGMAGWGTHHGAAVEGGSPHSRETGVMHMLAHVKWHTDGAGRCAWR